MATGKENDDTGKTDELADKDPKHQLQEESRLLQGIKTNYCEGLSEERRIPPVKEVSDETRTPTRRGCVWSGLCWVWSGLCWVRSGLCWVWYGLCWVCSRLSTCFSRKTVPRAYMLRYTTTRKQENMYKADSKIMNKLKEMLLSFNIQLSEEPSQRDSANVPCIVFCVFASRLAADVADVFPSHLKASPIILVILHPIDEELLIDKMSSHNSSLGDYKKKCQDRIIHFAFTKEQGVYSCDQNNKSFDQFERILRKLV